MCIRDRNQTGRGIPRFSVDSSSRISAFVRKREPGIGIITIEHHARRQLSDRRPVLEAMTGPTAGDPDVVVLRMAIDKKVACLGVLVRADACLCLLYTSPSPRD